MFIIIAFMVLIIALVFLADIVAIMEKDIVFTIYVIFFNIIMLIVIAILISWIS